MPSPLLYSLPRLSYARLRFTLRAEGQASLPPYQGSLLRGAFGHALRRTVCSMGPDQPCPECPLRQVCVYARWFEARIEGESPPFLRGLPVPPRPYVFEPGTEERSFAPGDPLSFDLLVFGQAIDTQAYALVAVERMARAGLGAGRVPFELDRVETALSDGGWQEVYVPGRTTMALGKAPPLVPSDEPLNSQAVLRFLTPTRLQSRGKLLTEPDFRTLAFLMLRRTLEMAWFQLPGAEIDWTIHPLLDRASGVKTTSVDLHWHDWQRYSNRQGTKIGMGGFVGTMALEGDLAPFGPLLRTAEVLHVGKGATLGMGKVEVSAGA
jgi:hypothetical protein